jgi:hypothetical protein
MTRDKLIIPALAATASAIALGLAAPTHAAPVGPCAEVPYIGVCVPASEHPTPPQQSSGETAFIPEGTSSIPFVN